MLKFEPAQRPIAGEVLTSIMEALKRRHTPETFQAGLNARELAHIYHDTQRDTNYWVEHGTIPCSAVLSSRVTTDQASLKVFIEDLIKRRKNEVKLFLWAGMVQSPYLLEEAATLQAKASPSPMAVLAMEWR
ncbi:hypothetical protein VTO58DRAFT_100534 [Aureobasidium pullulans]